MRRERERVARRRRLVAAGAVFACVGLNVWGVTSGAFGTGVLTDSTSATAGVQPTPAAPTPAATGQPTPAAPSRATAPRSAPTSKTPAPSTPAPKAPTPTASPTVVERGDGTFTVLAVPAGAIQQTPASGRTVRYTVEVEGGLGVDTVDYARTVARVLSDPKGWQTQDKVRFVNVTPDEARRGDPVDVRVTLASPDTTDRLCAPLLTRGRVSCFARGRAVLNVKRWLLGVSDAYGKDVATYRIYQVNHEVGHGIGHGHATCPGKGLPAPVMMQQSYGLDGCSPWPWPTPKPA